MTFLLDFFECPWAEAIRKVVNSTSFLLT